VKSVQARCAFKLMTQFYDGFLDADEHDEDGSKSHKPLITVESENPLSSSNSHS